MTNAVFVQIFETCKDLSHKLESLALVQAGFLSLEIMVQVAIGAKLGSDVNVIGILKGVAIVDDIGMCQLGQDGNFSSDGHLARFVDQMTLRNDFDGYFKMREFVNSVDDRTGTAGADTMKNVVTSMQSGGRG